MMAKVDLVTINATGSNQPCNTFGVNKVFPLALTLYNQGKAIFFANMGVLQYPFKKTNYTQTNSQLFAHNTQQRALQKLDMEGITGETGAGGCLMDTLKKLGYKTLRNLVNSFSMLAAGSPSLNNPTRQVSSGSAQEFNQLPTLSSITRCLQQLNGLSDCSTNSLLQALQ